MKNVIIITNEDKRRIKSNHETVLHKIIDKTMIEKVVDNFIDMEFDAINTIIAKDHMSISDNISDKSEITVISKDNHNVIKDIVKDEEGITVLTFGNAPLITKETYETMMNLVKEHPMVILTADSDNEYAQDIVLRNPAKTVRSIIPYRDASIDQKSIREISMDIYAFNTKLLYKYLQDFDSSDITSLVSLFKADKHSVYPHEIEDPTESIIIHSREDLVVANNWERSRVNRKHLENGVTILDLASTTIGTDVIINMDTTIYPNNTLIGKTVIGENNVLKPNNHIEDSIIGSDNEIEQSKLVDVEIGEKNHIGPWTNLRTGVKIGKANKIGTYVELKNTVIKDHNAISHNVYLGDTTVGSHCNIGWGVVTANYDGINKNSTTIKDNSFIGSNSTIIAPVNIGTKVVIAAGSVINKDVKDNDMAIARARQECRENKGKEYLERVE